MINPNILKNLGYDLIYDENSILIKRTTRGIVIDAISIFLGFLSLFVMLGALFSWYNIIFNGAADVMVLVSAVGMSVVGGYGIVLFAKGIDRLILGLSSEIRVENSEIFFKKNSYSNAFLFNLNIDENKAKLFLNQSNEQIEVLRFEGLNKIYINTLNDLVFELNSRLSNKSESIKL